MPELPEVENTVKKLKALNGCLVKGVFLFDPLVLKSGKSYLLKIKGSKIKGFFRQGKYIFCNLSKERCNFYLVIHLGMSGFLAIKEKDDVSDVAEYLRFLLVFNKGFFLAFCDIRKFGKVFITKKPLLTSLGEDPLSPNLTPAKIAYLFKEKKQKIKSLLLRQDLLSGIGNIYADEALWLAGIKPTRLGTNIKEDEWTKLYKAIKKVLQTAIKAGGTDLGDEVVPSGRYTPLVYGREGFPCSRCRAKIVREKIASRSSYFCSCCQK